MPTVLITGANRGLGLEFCRQYVGKGWDVIACCRNPVQAGELNELSQRYTSIQIEALDVAYFDQIDNLSTKLSDTSIDVLINNAGIYGDHNNHGFGQLDYQAWLNT
ncbi:MAG: SDR family NAD(P)-dependent oxidoreductase, partial [Methyloglobulus sp.]